MATYVSLLYFTNKTFENIKSLPSQLEEAKKVYSSMGVDLKEAYLAMGREFDAVIVSEASDAEAMMRVNIHVSMQGNARAETFQIFSSSEFDKLVETLP